MIRIPNIRCYLISQFVQGTKSLFSAKSLNKAHPDEPAVQFSVKIKYMGLYAFFGAADRRIIANVGNGREDASIRFKLGNIYAVCRQHQRSIDLNVRSRIAQLLSYAASPNDRSAQIMRPAKH